MSASAPQQTMMHSTFSVKRTYPVTPERVFAAFANPITKRRWFAEVEGFTIDEYSLDFRVGGRELTRFRFGAGEQVSNETIFLDILPDQRIIFTFTMKGAERLISISLATIEIRRASQGTQLIYTEQGAFFGVADKMINRKYGTAKLFDRLGQDLSANG